jgi:nicotinate-nucleotide adenylyltransferase
MSARLARDRADAATGRGSRSRKRSSASEAGAERAQRAEGERSPARIGVLGGTFNPIHVGHLHAAEQVREQLGLARVLFVPAADPPLKRAGEQPIAPARLRLAWVEAALRGRPAFAASDIELRREGPSYTVDTLRALREQLAPARLVFIVGEDAFAELDAWREPASLLTLADFAVMTRPPELGKPLRGLISDALASAIDWAADGESGTHRTAGTRIARVRIRALDVSATEIRRRIRSRESVRYLLPEAVHDDVIASGAYEAK